MKLTLFSILLMLSSITTAYSKSFKCEDSVDTDMKIFSSFDSLTPTLESKIITYNPDGTIQAIKQKVFLSPNLACGTDINFKNDCSFIEKENGLGYNFDFYCSNQKIKGNIYIDEAGFVQLQCSNQEHPSVFCY